MTHAVTGSGGKSDASPPVAELAADIRNSRTWP